jgi:hypothetical protein
MEAQYELSPVELFYKLVHQFREEGLESIRFKLENEFGDGTLYNLSRFGYGEFTVQYTRIGQIEHIIETICLHSANEEKCMCIFCGEHTHNVSSCCDPRIEETWLQLFEEINKGDEFGSSVIL